MKGSNFRPVNRWAPQRGPGMAANTQGVGDPLGHENPYRDGRPNWNLQVSARATWTPFRWSETLRSATAVRPPLVH